MDALINIAEMLVANVLSHFVIKRLKKFFKKFR